MRGIKRRQTRPKTAVDLPLDSLKKYKLIYYIKISNLLFFLNRELFLTSLNFILAIKI